MKIEAIIRQLLSKLLACGSLAILCIGLVACQTVTPVARTPVLVKQVVSAQTLEVVDISQPNATPRRVRLMGIDAPDLQQLPWGIEAQNQLKTWIGSQPVLLEFDQQTHDAYQRQLVYVWQDGKLLNEELVKAGLAIAISRPSNTQYDQRLADAQEWARLMGVGIWNPENPLRFTPAEFRQRNQ
ncbi:thermonuclease family protein [Desertifilum sp. FACHB-1129]|uniref:thermonuclease family protein n=1 Tax=unclassified Desertifilum TaxID=2621682 RepID=UPI0016845838|nr:MULTISPECIES: thermonuclease family protein [unclassified Desertifilum]MBD2313344.1 thermonuclease family protein [Desertifilum sp. FACHB-1129]MBD2324415.1 thermonuclease family protein [Desertifilum sp. FACHB-866]MBD2334429.1 thermonuclease family protein [Desertifilum sp. FACHB-868]MDA0212732.1 thermonuclease family protein [Cyanobacteria bacterium FC1]